MRFDIPEYGSLPAAGWWLIYGDLLGRAPRQFWLMRLPVFRYGEIPEPWRDGKRLGWQQLAIGRTRSITGRNDTKWHRIWLDTPSQDTP